MEVHGGGDVWVQLATRIPKALHRDLKLHCVRAEQSVMDFVTKALKEKLEREKGAQPATSQQKPYRRSRR
jgi:hypothetical protein